MTKEGDQAMFAGNHSDTNDPLPEDGHPRSNGDLIAVAIGTDPTTFLDDIVIAGTYKDGVRIFIEGGEEEDAVIEPSGFVRSIGYNDAFPTIAYAAIQFQDTTKNGIYKIDFSDLDIVESELVYATLRPEGLTVLSSGNVYGAIGKAGIVKYNGSTWELKNSNLSINNSKRLWSAVTGYRRTNSDVVYIGVNNLRAIGSGENYCTVWRSGNGGSTWTPLVDVDTLQNVSDHVYGQSYNWWYRTQAFPQGGLGRKNSVVSSIDVSRGTFDQIMSDDIIYVSGRGDIWKSEDGGSNWNPAVFNMQATSNRGVAVNPNNPAQVAIGNTDYVILEMSDHFENDNISRDKPQGAESRGYDVTFDVVSNEIIAGVGDRDVNVGGEVFIKSTDDLGNSSIDWLDTKLLDATPNVGRARAISYGYHDGTSQTSQAVLAAVEGKIGEGVEKEGGVYRYYQGSWTKSQGISIGSTKRSNLVWPDNVNSGVVYLLDLSTGFYRSNNGGQNWTNIWPCMTFNNKDFFNTGFIAADDQDPTTVYLSMQSANNSCLGRTFKVYRMENANTSLFGDPSVDPNITEIGFDTDDMKINRPGPIVIGPDGKLWLTQQQDSKNSIYGGLFVIDDPKNDLRFTDLTTDDYRDIAIQPSGIDVSSDGYVYVSQNGVGLVKLRYTEDVANISVSNECIEIYPDPSNNIYTISGTLSMYDIDILDSNGQVHSTVDNSGTIVHIDVSDLPNGTYIVRATHPTIAELCVEKILKF